MMGFTIARPSSVLHLGLSVQYHDFFAQPRESKISAVWSLKFLQAVRWEKGNGDPLKARRGDHKAIYSAARARQYVANRMLVLNDMPEAEKELIAQYQSFVVDFPTTYSKPLQEEDKEVAYGQLLQMTL